jgi:rod shape determining protein RodA
MKSYSSNTKSKSPLKNVDWVTVLIYMALVIFGWMNIYSAAVVPDHPSAMDMSQEYGKQFLFILISSFLAFLILYMEGDFFNKFAFPIYIVSIIMLMLVLVIGKEVKGARAWIDIGGFRLQPTEFAKIGVGLLLAKYISGTKAKFADWKTRLTAGAIMAVPAGLILLQPDVGSLLTYTALILPLYREGLSGNVLIVGIGAIILGVLSVITGFWKIDYPFFGQESGVYMLIGIILISAIILAVLIKNFVVPRNRRTLYLVVLFSAIGAGLFSFSVNFIMDDVLAIHQKQRIYVTLGLEEKDELEGDEITIDAEAALAPPKKKDDDPGYNARMAKIAVGNGGLIGQGFMQGPMTKNKYVPERWTDFIFSVISEEWGFAGSISIVILFVYMIIRLINMAERQRSQFSRIYGYCVASILFMHLVINIGMVIGLAPIIGIPLPFLSYGGSSLIGFTLLLFIFLRLDAERLSVFS